MTKLLSLFFVLTITLGSVFGSTTIIGGRVDHTDNLNGVLLLFPNGQIGCTAAKISENHILTAAHCLIGKDIQSLGFSTSTLVNKASATFSQLSVDRITIHSGYLYLSQTGLRGLDLISLASDLAVIKVKSTLEFKKLKILKLDFAPVPQGQEVEFWGYGCQQHINHSESISSRQRARTKTLGKTSLEDERLKRATLSYGHLADQLYSLNILTPGKQLDPAASSLCPGDSGGPLLVGGKLVGVNAYYAFLSFDPAEVSYYGISYLNLHTRLKAAAQWLNDVLKN